MKQNPETSLHEIQTKNPLYTITGHDILQAIHKDILLATPAFIPRTQNPRQSWGRRLKNLIRKLHQMQKAYKAIRRTPCLDVAMKHQAKTAENVISGQIRALRESRNADNYKIRDFQVRYKKHKLAADITADDKTRSMYLEISKNTLIHATLRRQALLAALSMPQKQTAPNDLQTTSQFTEEQDT